MSAEIRAAHRSREEFLEAAARELAKCEQREMEFSRRERRERAAELQIPLDKGISH
jgi:hypothetical protein